MPDAALESPERCASKPKSGQSPAAPALTWAGGGVRGDVADPAVAVDPPPPQAATHAASTSAGGASRNGFDETRIASVFYPLEGGGVVLWGGVRHRARAVWGAVRDRASAV
jgi:hypothetical protein